MTATDLRGEPVADSIHEAVDERVAALGDRGVTPTLGTVLMSDDPDDVRFLELKHGACSDYDIDVRDRRVPPDAPASALYETIGALASAPRVDAVFVQIPLPDHVDRTTVGQRLDPEKDVDCFHPENVGRLVDGNPRFVSATTVAVVRLLAHYEVPVAGRDVVVVGRSTVIGKSIANRLLWDDDRGNATVTVCHTQTADLAAHVGRADVLVTACGVPELIDGSMLADGVVVVDVSANQQEGDQSRVVGDVEASSAREKASAITPVPGGIGPITLATLLENVVLAAERRTQ